MKERSPLPFGKGSCYIETIESLKVAFDFFLFLYDSLSIHILATWAERKAHISPPSSIISTGPSLLL